MARRLSNTHSKNATNGLSRLVQILLLTMAIVSIAALAFLAVAKYAETFEAPNKTNLTYKGTYNVVYDGNFPSSTTEAQRRGVPPVDSTKYTLNQEVTVLGNVSETPLEAIGFTFAGWDGNPSATTPQYQPGDKFTIEQDTKLYAVWKEDKLSAHIEASPGEYPPKESK